ARVLFDGNIGTGRGQGRFAALQRHAQGTGLGIPNLKVDAVLGAAEGVDAVEGGSLDNVRRAGRIEAERQRFHDLLRLTGIGDAGGLPREYNEFVLVRAFDADVAERSLDFDDGAGGYEIVLAFA